MMNWPAFALRATNGASMSMAEEIWEVGDSGEVSFYTGNFTDYLGKRHAQQTPKPKAAPKAAPAQPKPQKLRFSFNEQREYQTIEQDIASLEQDVSHCADEMEQAGSDYVRLQQLTEEKQALEQQLSDKMDRWVYLSDLADRIEAQK